MEALSYSWPSRLAMAVGPLLALLIYFLLPEQYSDEKVAEAGPGAPA
jgi:hypothetical protein